MSENGPEAPTHTIEAEIAGQQVEVTVTETGGTVDSQTVMALIADSLAELSNELSHTEGDAGPNN